MDRYSRYSQLRYCICGLFITETAGEPGSEKASSQDLQAKAEKETLDEMVREAQEAARVKNQGQVGTMKNRILRYQKLFFLLFDGTNRLSVISSVLSR